MELKDQVCTWEQGERLLQLGMTSYGLFVHYRNSVLPSDKGVKPKEQTASWAAIGEIKNGGVISYCPAFTASELGEMLPDYLVFDNYRCHFHCFKQEQRKSPALWTCTYGKSNDKDVPDFDSHYEAHARAALLIHLLERNLVNPQSTNQ